MVALGDGLVGVERVYGALVLLGDIGALVGVLVIHPDGEGDEHGHKKGQADRQAGRVAPVLERRRVRIGQLDDLDVAIGRYLDGLGRIGDRIDGALPLANARAVDLYLAVGDLEERVLERKDAIELETADAADEAHVGPHGLVAADEEVARRVEYHVDVGAAREVERVGHVLVHLDADGLAAVGAAHDDVVVLAVAEIVGRIELEVVEAVVEADAHAAVVVHLEREVVGETLLVALVRHDLHDDALLVVGGELRPDRLLLGGGDAARRKRVLDDVARLEYGADLGAAYGPAEGRERAVALECRVHLDARAAVQARAARALAHTAHRHAVQALRRRRLLLISCAVVVGRELRLVGRASETDEVDDLAVDLEAAHAADEAVAVVDRGADGQVGGEEEGPVGVQVLRVAGRYGVDVHARLLAVALDLHGVPLVVVEVEGRGDRDDLDARAGRVAEGDLARRQQLDLDEIGREVAHLLEEDARGGARAELEADVARQRRLELGHLDDRVVLAERDSVVVEAVALAHQAAHRVLDVAVLGYVARVAQVELVERQVGLVLEQAVVVALDERIARVTVAVHVRVVALLVDAAAALLDAVLAAAPVVHGLVGATHPPAVRLRRVVQELGAQALEAHVLRTRVRTLD